MPCRLTSIDPHAAEKTDDQIRAIRRIATDHLDEHWPGIPPQYKDVVIQKAVDRNYGGKQARLTVWVVRLCQSTLRDDTTMSSTAWIDGIRAQAINDLGLDRRALNDMIDQKREAHTELLRAELRKWFKQEPRAAAEKAFERIERAYEFQHPERVWRDEANGMAFVEE